MACSTTSTSSGQCLPAKTAVKTSSYTWNITLQKIRQATFLREDIPNRSRVVREKPVGVQSNSFKCCVIRNGCLEEKQYFLWLSRDTIKTDGDNSKQLSPWMRLTLTPVLEEYVLQFDAAEQNNHRNICNAWISGRQKCMCRLVGCCFSSVHLSFYNPEFVRYDDLFNSAKELVCDGVLTIVCEVHAYTSDISSVDSWLFDPSPKVVHSVDRTLMNDIKRLLSTGQDSDVSIVANDGQVFPAHMLILSSRSPVFAAMFEHNMKEKQQQRVNIEDLSSDAVKSLLQFVYTDKVSNINKMALELLPAANKYDISRLKTLCEETVLSNLQVDNAADIFCLAHLYNADQLRSTAKKYIVRRIYDVKKTGGWQKLRTEWPQLAEEIFDEIAELMRKLSSD